MRLNAALSWIRLSCFIGVVCIAITVVAVSAARARTLELAESVGAQLMRFAGAERQDEPRELLVNGLTLHLSSGATKQAVSDVLDRFEGKCLDRFDGALQPLRDGAAADPILGPRWLERVPIERQEDDTRGMVACLDPMGSDLSPAALLRRLERFVDTGDLAAVGELRLVFARRGQTRTAFVAIWTEGSTPLFDAFPAEGDAPGRDVPGVVRPPHSRRLLSAREAETDPELAVYESAAPVEASAGHYRERMAELGWTLHDHPEESGPELTALGFEKNGRVVTVTVAEGPQGGSVVSVTALE